MRAATTSGKIRKTIFILIVVGNSKGIDKSVQLSEHLTYLGYDLNEVVYPDCGG